MNDIHTRFDALVAKAQELDLSLEWDDIGTYLVDLKTNCMYHVIDTPANPASYCRILPPAFEYVLAKE